MSAEDTPRPDGDASGRQITERKVKADGSVQEFACRLVHRGRGLAVVRFVVKQAGMFQAPVAIEAGTVSDGWFWERRPYSLYRMRGPDGRIVAHRFDAVGGVEIEDETVTFHDLVLDWWVLPDGTVLEEDAAELEGLRASGRLTAGDEERARRARMEVLSRYRHIIDGVAEDERRLGLWGG